LRNIKASLEKRQIPNLPTDFDYRTSFKIALMHHHISLPYKQPPEIHFFKLKDADNVIKVFGEIGIDMILCGHQHHPYHGSVAYNMRSMRFSCAGSTTKFDESVNSFKVYSFKSFSNISMEEYWVIPDAGLYRFTPSPPISL
jgi:hypothetical protein